MRRPARRGPVPALRAVAWTSLAVLVLAPAAFVAGWTDLDTVKWVMLAATAGWFAAAGACMWMRD